MFVLPKFTLFKVIKKKIIDKICRCILCQFALLVNPWTVFLTTHTTPIQKLPLGSRVSLKLISMLIFQTLLKYNMQKRRLNSSVNNKSSLHPYLEIKTLLLSLLLLSVTNTNPLDFSWQVAMIPNSAKYGPLRRPTATASSQHQGQISTAGRVDQLWTKEEMREGCSSGFISWSRH